MQASQQHATCVQNVVVLSGLIANVMCSFIVVVVMFSTAVAAAQVAAAPLVVAATVVASVAVVRRKLMIFRVLKGFFRDK